MADENIKKEFIDGINEVFSIMFTDGTNDGIYLYPLHEPTELNVYKEVKYKKYSPPVLLVAKVQLTPTQGEEDVKTIEETATFTVPFKSLRDNGIDTSNKNLNVLRKGVVKYKDTFYEIDNIKPNTFVEDTFMTYIFECTEKLEMTSVSVVEV